MLIKDYKYLKKLYKNIITYNESYKTYKTITPSFNTRYIINNKFLMNVLYDLYNIYIDTDNYKIIKKLLKLNSNIFYFPTHNIHLGYSGQ
jgi:hypothetical protein